MSLSESPAALDVAFLAVGVLVAAGFFGLHQQNGDPYQDLRVYRAACVCGAVWFSAWRVAASGWLVLPFLLPLAAMTYVAVRRARLCQSCRAVVRWFSPKRPCACCGRPVVR